MHFTYKESCAEVGYYRNLTTPTKKYTLLGYKDGNVIECQDESTWNKFKLKERIVTKESQLLWDNFWNTQHEYENLANHNFSEKLKEYFSELSPAQYDLCYNKAYDYAHSEGFDSVADKMEEYVEMCKEFVLCEGKE